MALASTEDCPYLSASSLTDAANTAPKERGERRSSGFQSVVRFSVKTALKNFDRKNGKRHLTFKANFAILRDPAADGLNGGMQATMIFDNLVMKLLLSSEICEVVRSNDRF